MSYSNRYDGCVKNRTGSKPAQGAGACVGQESAGARANPASSEPVASECTPSVDPAAKVSTGSIIARRMVQMGLAPAPFPAGGASLFQIVPWWCVWPRKARYNTIDGYGAAVFPSAVIGTMSLACGASIGQAVFAAMLPIFDPVRPVDQRSA